MPVKHDQLAVYIKKLHDDEGKTFKDITRILEKEGYKGRNTNDAISEPTVRYYYYYGARRVDKKKTDQGEVMVKDAESKFKLLKNIIKMKAEPAAKLSLIEQILEDEK